MLKNKLFMVLIFLSLNEAVQLFSEAFADNYFYWKLSTPFHGRLSSPHHQLRCQMQTSVGDTLVHLDLHSLAQLQSGEVPHTDDSPKYHYSLAQDGKYGMDEF